MIKFKINIVNYWGEKHYYINTEHSFTSVGISFELKVPASLVNDILIRNGGHLGNRSQDYVFLSKYEVERAIMELESIEILNKLVD